MIGCKFKEAAECDPSDLDGRRDKLLLEVAATLLVFIEHMRAPQSDMTRAGLNRAAGKLQFEVEEMGKEILRDQTMRLEHRRHR